MLFSYKKSASGSWTLPCCLIIFFRNFILIWKCQKWSLNRGTLVSVTKVPLQFFLLFQTLPLNSRLFPDISWTFWVGGNVNIINQWGDHKKGVSKFWNFSGGSKREGGGSGGGGQDFWLKFIVVWGGGGHLGGNYVVSIFLVNFFLFRKHEQLNEVNIDNHKNQKSNVECYKDYKQKKKHEWCKFWGEKKNTYRAKKKENQSETEKIAWKRETSKQKYWFFKKTKTNVR